MRDSRAYIYVAWWFLPGADPGFVGPETYTTRVEDSLRKGAQNYDDKIVRNKKISLDEAI